MNNEIEELKEAFNKFLNTCHTIEKHVDIPTNTTLTQYIRYDILQFLMYLSSATGKCNCEEVQFINELLDVGMTTEQVDELRVVDIKSEEYVTKELAGVYLITQIAGSFADQEDNDYHGLPARFSNKYACYDTVYIISNWGLEKQYSELQKEDTASWKAFLRRISEVREYKGIPMPRLLEVDTQQERILKEYIAGKTVAELLKTGQMESDWLVQVQEMCARLYPAGLNIDYYPTNFVPCDGTLYYIDYECNVYMEEWDFEHWGIQYWTMQASERTDKT